MNSSGWGTLGRWILLGILLIGLGLSFGLNYGASNQLYYLLPSLVEANSGILTRDWLITETKHYHRLFGAVGTWLILASPSGWLIALASVGTIAAGGLAAAHLARVLDRRGWFLATVLTLTLCMATRTVGPGNTSAFSTLFQPSSLGVLGLLVGAMFFTRGQYWQCGVALALGGAFHANYLLMGILVFGAAGVCSSWVESRHQPPHRIGLTSLRTSALLLLPSALVLLWMLPMILASSSSPDAAEVQRIYQDVRGPHHYVVSRFWPEFLPWLSWHALGAGALWEKRKLWGGRGRRLQWLLLTLLLLVAVCALFSSVVRIRSINHLFAWRIAPIGALWAQVAFFAAGSARTPWWPRSSAARSLQIAGLLLLVTDAALKRDPSTLGIVGGAYALWCMRGALFRRRWPAAVPLTLGLALSLFSSAAVPNLRSLEGRSNLLRERPPGLGKLCSWIARNTPVDAMFLTPPDLHEFRFHCRRAVVVDWKADPLLPNDFLVWIRRMQDVTGQTPLTGEADVRGYYALDAARLRQLVDRYDVEYVVTRKGKHRRSPKTERLYSSKHFEVYRATRSNAKPAP